MGDIMMDIAIKPHGEVRAASDTASTIRLGVGGTGANTAIHLARLGVNTLLLGRVGDDDFGRLARERLGREGVALPDAPCAGVATGAIGVLIDARGQRTMFPQRGANDFVKLEFVRDHWPAVRALFVSGYVLFQEQSRAAALWAMGQAREAGVPVLVDPASYALIEDVGAQNFLRWIASATVLLPNREEATVLANALSDGAAVVAGQMNEAVTPLDAAQRAAQLLAGRFPVVVLTVDEQGALARQGQDVLYVPAEKVSAVDTTGAGDAFNAGFLAQYVAGADLHKAIKAGNRSAARVVQQIGPT